MNPDREMQAEAMDEAQDEILRLQEALAVEKGAHMETAKALVACREELRASIEVMQKIQPMAEVDECAVACQIADNQDALSHTAGDDYVSKASVKPIVDKLLSLLTCSWCGGCIGHPQDHIHGCKCDPCPECGHKSTPADICIKEAMWAFEQVKLLGLV